MSANPAAPKQISVLNHRAVVEQTRKPEILFVWDYHEWGGAQIYFLGIMREAVKTHRVKVVMPSGSGGRLLEYLRTENIPIEFFPANSDSAPLRGWWAKLNRRIGNWRAHWIIARHLREQGLRGKIVQMDVAPWAAVGLLFFLALQTHVFITMHAGLPAEQTWRAWSRRRKFHLLCALPKFHLLASNNDVRESLRGFVPARVWREIPVAHTGVNTVEIREVLQSEFERDTLRRQLGLPVDQTVVLGAGNLFVNKGFLVLLQAARRLRETHQNLFYVWIGDGAERGEMQQQVTENGLTENFKIISPAAVNSTRQSFLQTLGAADIYVHPSYFEGLPGTLLEAMALEIPVIASAINAIPEAVEDNVTGLLVAAGDTVGLAAAIAKLVDNSYLREELAAAGQNRVLTQFVETRAAAITLEFYEKSLTKQAAA